MTKSTPLTILVPTCDRPDTLGPCLETLVAQDRDDIQIFVSDNFSGPETERVIRSFDDPRITSVRTERRLGMSAHWDFALQHARGEWITIVGDDDGLLLDGASRFLELAARSDVDAISSLRCMYVWPMPGTKGDGVLTIASGSGFEVRGSREWLERVVRHGESYAHLPWIYTGGFVKRSVMDGIRARMGRCFSSINPDIYTAVAVASVLPRYGYSHDPFTIGGTSSHSNGLNYFTTKSEDKSSIAFFRENDLQFHPSLGDGFVPSLHVCVYEACVQSAPLRSFDLGTTLWEQLCLAMAMAKGDVRERTTKYCRKVAEANGLPADRLEAAASRFRMRLKVRRELRRLRRRFSSGGQRHEMEIRSPQLDTVMSAAREISRQLARA